MKNNILMLLQSNFPPDIRLTKEMKALTQYHNVFLLCNNNFDYKVNEVVENVHVYRMPAMGKLPCKLAKLVRLPLFFNPLWIFKAITIIKTHKITSIHAHDLPMAPLGILLGKWFKLPVVYDMHENYPAAMKEWGKKGLFNFIFKNHRLARLLDYWCINQADKIIVVVEEQQNNLISQGVPSEKIHIVSNTVDLELLFNQTLKSDIVDKYKNSFLITYIGTFSVERGLDTAIHAMGQLKDTIPNCKLLLAGDGHNRNDLIKLTKELNLENFIDFPGWIDYQDYLSYIETSDICIIPQPSNSSNDTTIPHKLFEIMAAGKPVLASDAKPLYRIINDCKCGKTFKSNSPESFAKAVIQLYKKQLNYGENGRKAVTEKYNWEIESVKLLNVYKNLKMSLS